MNLTQNKDTMGLKLVLAILLTNQLLLIRCQINFGGGFKLHYPCKGNKNIYFKHSNGQAKDNEHLFFVYLNEVLPAKTVVNMTFILPSEQTQADPGAELTIAREKVIDIVLFENQNNLNFSLRTVDNQTPYVGSVLVNNVEKCINPIREFDEFGPEPAPNNLPTYSTDLLKCGRRQKLGTPLVVNGESSKPGDWPWHVELSTQNKNLKPEHTGGGTLLSASIVLTAAHCLTESGKKIVPSRLFVTVGKYHLIQTDNTAQVVQAFQSKVHNDFNPDTLQNDIALLELSTEITFSDFIQPACLWNSQDFFGSEIYGTVVGWGINANGSLTETLEQLSMPKIDDLTCIHSNPVFFEHVLNGKNFCAGYHNVTHPRSVCNGDSGGGFFVFVPDIPGDESPTATGTWHVRGIVSQGVRKTTDTFCDPTQFSVFTDVLHYLDWIENALI